MLGEITYRLAEEILDGGAYGAERFFRETLAGLVNPVHGLNRLLDGSAFRASGPVRDRGSAPAPAPAPVPRRHRRHPHLQDEGDGRPKTKDAQRVPKATTEFLFWYGDEFAAERPFDFFLDQRRHQRRPGPRRLRLRPRPAREPSTCSEAGRITAS